MEEIWRDIYGYDGLYQVSNYGNVKSLNYLNHGKEQILKPANRGDGYLFVALWKNGKQKGKLIHRLVAEAFIPNDDLFKTQVNHKDENKANNNVENLEWCDCTYNNNYGTRLARFAKSMSKPVNQYSKDGKTLIKIWNSMNEIERQLGFDNSSISKCCLGKHKSAYGFRWEYA